MTGPIPMLALMDYCENFNVKCGLPRGAMSGELSALADEAVPMLTQAIIDSAVGDVEDGVCLYDHFTGKFLKGYQLLAISKTTYNMCLCFNCVVFSDNYEIVGFESPLGIPGEQTTPSKNKKVSSVVLLYTIQAPFRLTSSACSALLQLPNLQQLRP